MSQRWRETKSDRNWQRRSRQSWREAWMNRRGHLSKIRRGWFVNMTLIWSKRIEKSKKKEGISWKLSIKSMSFRKSSNSGNRTEWWMLILQTMNKITELESSIWRPNSPNLNWSFKNAKNIYQIKSHIVEKAKLESQTKSNSWMAKTLNKFKKAK